MIVCLDANVVIYLIEKDPVWRPPSGHGCGLFLTADSRLGRCTAIPVEVLA